MAAVPGVYLVPVPPSQGPFLSRPFFPASGFAESMRNNVGRMPAGAGGVPITTWNTAYEARWHINAPAAVWPPANADLFPFRTSPWGVNGNANPDSFAVPAKHPPISSQRPSSLSQAANGISASKRLEHAGKAALFVLSALLLRHLPSSPTRLSNTLLSPDWKEWAKVGLGIAGMKQINDALNWKPPLWLNAMLNVVFINPLVSGFAWKNVIQGLILAPVVGVMVQGSHYASSKSEKPLERYLHIPPLVTRAMFSIGTMLAGLKVFPRVSDAIPRVGPATAGATVETSVVTSCANGCCTSAICANDIGQLGATLLRSLRNKSDQDAHSQ